jgi:hypothetical protein
MTSTSWSVEPPPKRGMTVGPTVTAKTEEDCDTPITPQVLKLAREQAFQVLHLPSVSNLCAHGIVRGRRDRGTSRKTKRKKTITMIFVREVESRRCCA